MPEVQFTQATVLIDQINIQSEAQPSKGFLKSVRRFGVLEQVILTPTPDGDRYNILFGRRRVIAAKEAGQERINAAIPSALTIEQIAMVTLTENMQRSANPLLEARMMRVLIESGYNQQSIAEELGVSQPQVAQRLRLLNLCEEVQAEIEGGNLTISIAKHMAGLDHDQQRSLLALADAEGRKLNLADINAVKREAKIGTIIPDLPTPLTGLDIALKGLDTIRNQVKNLTKEEKGELVRELGEFYLKLSPPKKKA